MALDLALDGGRYTDMVASNSIVSMLVTAGASMTGNSRVMQTESTPYEWKRQAGPAVFPPVPTGGGRPSASSQRTLRRSEPCARVADGPDEDVVDVGPRQVVVCGAPEDISLA